MEIDHVITNLLPFPFHFNFTFHELDKQASSKPVHVSLLPIAMLLPDITSRLHPILIYFLLQFQH